MRELRELTDKLSREGWDRLRGLRLIRAATQVLDDCKRLEWLEGIGRAGTLAEVLGGFIHEAPHGEQLALALRLATGLAEHLEAGHQGALIDHDNLPVHPEEWLFLLVAICEKGRSMRLCTRSASPWQAPTPWKMWS